MILKSFDSYCHDSYLGMIVGILMGDLGPTYIFALAGEYDTLLMKAFHDLSCHVMMTSDKWDNNVTDANSLIPQVGCFCTFLWWI